MSEFTTRTLPLVREAIDIQRNVMRVENTSLTPKKARLIASNPDIPSPITGSSGDIMTLTGEGFVSEQSHIGKRTVFLEQPVLTQGHGWFLEVKGYGEDGHDLYPKLHNEGDLLYGMYFKNAAKEFYYPRELAEKGVKGIQQPVQLFQYAKDDFIHYSVAGLTNSITSKLILGNDMNRFLQAIVTLDPHIMHYLAGRSFNNETCRVIAQRIAYDLVSEYDESGLKGVRRFAAFLDIEDEVSGILDEENEYGYVIRAVTSPIRLGNYRLQMPRTRQAELAHQAGSTLREMAQEGYIHTAIHPGNWTTEGEIVDFEDVYSLPRDTKAFEGILGNDEMQHDVEKLWDLSQLHELKPPFIHGFLGQGGSEDDVYGVLADMIIGRLS